MFGIACFAKSLKMGKSRSGQSLKQNKKHINERLKNNALFLKQKTVSKT